MIKKIILAIVVFSLFSTCTTSHISDKVSLEPTKKYAPDGPIRDLVLIYSGSSHREQWDMERFKSYVYAPRQNGKGADWLFDGFLFLEIFDDKRCGFASGYRPDPAKKEDWLKLIDGYLTTGQDIMALDDCIEKAKKECGKLPKKRKVVISLPEPIPNQKDWGELDGTALDFTNEADRIAACQWYIDYITGRFEKTGLKNIELGGFYWLAEDATNSRSFVKNIADYIHTFGQRFYWIPYYKSDGYSTWRELGFDQAYLQPNHFFDSNIPDSRIDEACSLARQYGMSMEVEFHGYATKEWGMGARLQAYIDKFRQNGVFNESDVAYYNGDDGFNALSKGCKEDISLYYQLVNIVIERQKKLK